MKFEITSMIINTENIISDSEYSVKIILYVKEINDRIPVFTTGIDVVSNNSQTGYEVDEQRRLIIDKYINSLNS